MSPGNYHDKRNDQSFPQSTAHWMETGLSPFFPARWVTLPSCSTPQLLEPAVWEMHMCISTQPAGHALQLPVGEWGCDREGMEGGV